MKDEEEFDMLLNEIPREISMNLHHQQQYGYVHEDFHGVHGGDGDVDVDGFSQQNRMCGMNGVYGNDPLYNHKYNCVSPATGVAALQSESSSLSFSSSGFSSSDDASPTPPLFKEIKSLMPNRNTHYSNGLLFESSKLFDSPFRENVTEHLVDNLGLAENLGRIMHISDELQDSRMIGQSPMMGSSGFPFGSSQAASVGSRTINHGNVENNGLFDDYRNSFSDNEGLQCPFPVSGMLYNQEHIQPLMGFDQDCRMSNLLRSRVSSTHSNCPVYYPGHVIDPMSSPQRRLIENASNEMSSNLLQHAKVYVGRNYAHRLIPDASPFATQSFIPDAFLCSQQNEMDFSGGVQNAMPYSHPVINRREDETTNWRIPQSLSSIRGVHDIDDAVNCEGSLILQGKDLHCLMNKRCSHSKEQKRGSCNQFSIAPSTRKNSELGHLLHSREIHANSNGTKTCCPSILPRKYSSLLEVKGYIYFLAKDQNGCRFLQRKLDEPIPQYVQMILNEIIDHVVELMINPFGNYLMQRLLAVCNEAQRMQILLMVTSGPGKLVQISLNMHGTRSVQKLIETLKTHQEISLVISALEPGFLDLIKDPNGNHVVQCCLQFLSHDDNKFIFNAAAKFCVDIATHQHGCRVLQHCITHSRGKYQKQLVTRISANGLLLAQDTFGNYVIQYILDPKIFKSAVSNLISQFEGNYVHLSRQKCSSNVVEKCLEVFEETARSRIIHELLSTSHFEQLLHDPYANYVIQSALRCSKGSHQDSLYVSLVEAIRTHASRLKTCPNCRRIFSRILKDSKK